METSSNKVLVGMSGGVDSSVAAALLVEAGYQVEGVFMKNWSGSIKVPAGDGYEHVECDWRSERRDAMRVAAALNIPFHTVDFEKEYRERVVGYMVAEYKAGRTPNPDVLCNREIKFDLLFDVADKLGCSAIATGHYARVEDPERVEGPVRLKKGVDQNKDQSYFLCRLTQKELGRALFPVGELEKSKVRDIAASLGLVTAEKKDSQGLCFVGKIDLPTFLQQYIAPRAGDIVTTDGEVIGTHQGAAYFTIGQRHGLGIGGGEPWYVVARDMEANTVIVGHEDDPALYTSELQAEEVQWTSGTSPAFPWKGVCKTRYRQKDQACTVYEDGRVVFDERQRAVAPGQFVVFYEGDVLLGSGVIA